MNIPEPNRFYNWCKRSLIFASFFRLRAVVTAVFGFRHQDKLMAKANSFMNLKPRPKGRGKVVAANRNYVGLNVLALSYNYGVLFSILALLCGCNSDSLNVNLDGIEVELTVKRLDQDFFSLNPSAGETNTEALEAKYGGFLADYCDGMLRIGRPGSPSFPYSVAQFITEESVRTLYKDTQAEYENIDDIKEELTAGFRYFKYHFSDSVVPEIVFNISALNYAIVTTETTLAIGLDMFLGADYPVYPMVGFAAYRYANMKRQQVVPQAMKGWLQSMFETEAERNTLLEYMIFEGKLLYVLDAVLRNTPDSVKIGYTPQAMEWCAIYEPRIWAHLVDQELLFSTDHMAVNKWVNQAPFISGIPKESPGRLGQWVGWQMVRAYMNENPEITIQQLMNQQNAQSILTLSRYKPKL